MMARADRLYLDRDLANLARLNDWLAGLFDRAETPAELAGDMKLCLNEAVTNVISYGDSGTRPLQITVSVRVQADSIAAIVEDNCAVFDPTADDGANPITGLEDARIGGFGISLIRSTAASMRWQPLDTKGNRLTLICGRV